ncbi:hypothetical protein TNCT_335511 [Trichonephila clavata]|uniref:Uncharacterized protein n=1 Tax=Trichonephila clavata TaxID=2740835 RepID=A0A8X6HDR1_TRICU|nr:hypothetical protein TNCT_335511 [Trichonephila clavata]
MMNSDLADQLTEDITNCNRFSLQFDESVDVVDISQLCKNGFSGHEYKRRIIDNITPEEKKTRGEDVYGAFKK